MESTKLKVVKPYIDQREEQRLVQFLMALRDDFEVLREEEIRLKSNSNLIPDKGVPFTPLSIFAAPFHKGKPQGKVGHDINECAFWKEKGH
ncbi:hypothetical protein KIW84_013254 [Lathyrus oleraceus]|uniref:Uncharacterized protein n=1 Tax=Pisum sativum TaxID=3888 RepID=A0A9D5GXU7_PEA|nr:hypothetical protein KIW84_013254 [Pisum sativum]